VHPRAALSATIQCSDAEMHPQHHRFRSASRCAAVGEYAARVPAVPRHRTYLLTETVSGDVDLAAYAAPVRSWAMSSGWGCPSIGSVWEWSYTDRIGNVGTLRVSSSPVAGSVSVSVREL
jgi:hypothetical protein